MVGSVAVHGPLDAEHAGEIRPRLHAATAAADGELVIDLSGVTSIDATGLGMLVGARARMRQRGGDCRVVHARPAVATKISRAGLWALLTGDAERPASAPQLVQGTVA